MKTDVIVIGAGVAGLTAALFAARQGRQVTLLARGAGTLAFGGGTIDVLGVRDGRLVREPLAAMERLPEAHPYALVGRDRVREAILAFQSMCRDGGHVLEGEPEGNLRVLTVAGTLKPSCLVPESMNTDILAESTCLRLVQFTGLKDFYPELAARGLRGIPAYRNKEIAITIVEPGLSGGRDVTLPDIARWLDTPAGREAFIRQLKPKITGGTCLLTPPVLGTSPGGEVWRELEERLGCRLREMAAPPPGITGMRLRTLLLRLLRKYGVRIVENAFVCRAVIEDGHCRSVVTLQGGREKNYPAAAFVLATGGFLGGGLTAQPLSVKETVFDLPVENTLTGRMPGKAGLLEDAPVFHSGVRADSLLRPVDDKGQVLLDNVHLAGKILAGYDYCSEKSGNGVAIATAYQAAAAIAGRLEA